MYNVDGNQKEGENSRRAKEGINIVRQLYGSRIT